MRKLPHWVLTDSLPAFYDSESSTAIQQTAKLYGAMQELIDAYNQFVDLVNNHMSEQDGVIAAAVQYMKENLVETIKVLNKDGELDGSIMAAISNIENEISKRQQEMEKELDNMNDAVSLLANGSPLTASSVSQMTDQTRVYVNTSDGNWYYYNDSSWVVGGVYQASEIDSDNVQLDGRNIETDKLPKEHGCNSFELISGLANGYIINEGVGSSISFGNSTTRVTISEGNYLTSGSYKFINLNTTKYGASYIVLDSTTNLITRLYPWSFDETFTLTINENEIGYIVFKEINDAVLTVNEITTNFRICEGVYEPDNYQIFTPFNVKNPKVVGLDKKFYVYAGTIVFVNNRKYTIKEDQIISYSGIDDNKAIIVFNLKESQFEVVHPDAVLNYPHIHICFFTASGSFAGESSGVVITNHSFPTCFEIWGKKLDRKIIVNNLFDLELQNIVNTNPSTFGDNSNIRVSHRVPIRYNGKVTFVNKDNSTYRFAINSVNSELSNILSDTGWIVDEKYTYNFATDNYYFINFSKLDNSMLTKEEIEENFYIFPYDYSKEITSDVSENASKFKPILKNFHSVGHQGYGAGSMGYRGNSRSGFITAALHGFTDLECDVQVTSDNVMVLNHDATITDDAGETITISNITYEELLTHTFSGETIVTLEELLRICKQYGVNIYIDKSENFLANDTVKSILSQLIRKHQMSKRVTFVAYHYHVKTLAELEPYARILIRNITLTNDFMITYVIPYQTDKNEVGFTLDYSQHANETTYNFIANYVGTPLEFWTIDNVSNYRTIMNFASGVTSNTFTAYDVLTAE